MQNSLFETLVGALVVGIAFCFLIIGMRVTSIMLQKDGPIYYCVFESIDGIALSSEVKIGGVRVGAVSSIAFDEQYRVIVGIRIKKEIAVPEDSGVAIKTSGIMGDSYVEIIPGSAEETLSSGATFLYAKSPLNLEGIINKVIMALGNKNEVKEK